MQRENFPTGTVGCSDKLCWLIIVRSVTVDLDASRLASDHAAPRHASRRTDRTGRHALPAGGAAVGGVDRAWDATRRRTRAVGAQTQHAGRDQRRDGHAGLPPARKPGLAGGAPAIGILRTTATIRRAAGAGDHAPRSA